MGDLKPGVSAVISTWNKASDLRENLTALMAQTQPVDEIIVVDNHSADDTVKVVEEEFPDVKLIVMPDNTKGACETFNIGFKAASCEYTAIMDDDVVTKPDWLLRIMERFQSEPNTTAMISSKVVEPDMPEVFINSTEVNTERYMCTFRGCGAIIKTEILSQAGYYDEKFFIYGNERDLAARVLNLGYRILQFPSAEIFHKTPFGMKGGKRSLYYHTRNFWLYAFKNCSWSTVFSSALKLALKGFGFSSKSAEADATGTIGIDKSLKNTDGGFFITVKATFAAFALLPYCLRNRNVCKAPDFQPPVS